MKPLPWLDPSGLSVVDASFALASALRDGLDPENDPPRTSTAAPGGELLLMPASGGRYVGVKAVTVAPDNPARGLPRIHGVYLLFDGDTLAPLALVDGAALTNLRTPAVSLVAVARLTPDRPLRTVVFGTGPQARAHADAVAALRPGSSVTFVGRTDVPDNLADADLIICATTSATPVFDGSLPGDGTCVVAVGSHQPHVREVDRTFVDRAALYVEARAAATREAGEVANVDPARLTNLAELLSAPVDLSRPRLFKSVGMAWEDLIVASALLPRPGADQA